MDFNKFINGLSKEDRKNFEQYKDIRGVQIYKVVYNALKIKNDMVTYSDVNAFVIYDKAIKDVLYQYLGTLEEYLRNYILTHFDFSDDAQLNKDKYIYLSQLPKCEPKEISFGEITELYKRYALNFGDMKSFLVDYKVNICDFDVLERMRMFRNDVMHHAPLLFNYNSESTAKNTIECIRELINLLPISHRKGLAKDINNKTMKTKENINPCFYDFLLEEIKCVDI